MSSDIRPYVPPRLIIPAVGVIYATFADLAYPLMRIVAGAWLIPHGYEKLFGGGLPAFIDGLHKLGMEPAPLLANLVGGVEFFGGILIAIGLLTRPAALAATIVLLVATVKVHLPNGWSGPEGIEYPLMWMLLCFAVFLRGGERLSVDAALGREF